MRFNASRRTPQHSKACGIAALFVTLCSPFALAAEQELSTSEDLEVRGSLTPADKSAKHTLKTKPQHGAVTLEAEGFIYAPSKNYSGEDAFVIDAQKFTVRIAEVNDAPVAAALALAGAEDTTLTGTIVASDIERSALNYQVLSPASHGEASVDSKNGTVTFRPTTNFFGADSFLVEVSDGQATAQVEVKLSVSAVNDAPQASAAVLSLDEDATLGGALEATDVEATPLAFRVATKPQHGTLTLASTGTFSYVPARDFHGSDGFSFEVSDGQLSARGTATLEVKPVNDVPVAKPLALTTAEDTAVSGAVLASDLEGDVLSYSLKTAPEHGVASVDAKTGRVNFTPAADFFGTDALVVEVSDGQASASAPVKVAVSAVNDAPVAKAASVSGQEDVRLTGIFEATDLEAAALTYRLAKGPQHAEVTLDAKSGAFSVAPAPNWFGDDVFSVAVSDGALVTEASVKFSLAAVNDAPVAKPATLTTAEDTSVSGAFVASDVDGDALSYRMKSSAAHGEAQVDAKSGKVTYSPALNFNGADLFVLEVSDGTLTASADVKVVVTAVNDAPVAATPAASTDEDTTLKVALQASDVDSTTLTFRVATAPKHGELTVSAAGALTFVPARDFHGSDEFSYEVSDGQAAARETVKLTVIALNDAPVAKPLALSTAEDTAVKGTLLASDADGDALTYTLKTMPSHGAAVIEAKTGQLRFVPNDDFNGSDTFVLEVSDGQLSAQSSVTVAVVSVNDAPVASSSSIESAEDAKVQGVVLMNDVEHDVLSVRVIAKPKHGELTLNAQSGAFTFVPAANFHGVDAFTFDVADASLKSKVATLELSIISVNDAPVTRALALTTAEDVAAKAAVIASDVDGDVLTYRVATDAAHGVAAVDEKTGRVVYTPSADFNGSDTFVLEVDDGKAKVSCAASVTVNAVPDAPRIGAAVFAATEDQSSEGKLPGSDADADRLTFHLLSAARLGDAVLLDAATGVVRYTPRHDLNGDDEIAFDVSDGTSTVKGVMKIQVSPVNDAPTLVGVEIKTFEDRVGEAQLAGGDVDGDTLTYAILEAPKFGRASVDAATGRLRFEPPKDKHGQTSFTVVAHDGTVTSSPAQVTVTVDGQNDAPVAAAASLTGDEDVDVTGTFVASDVDGDALSFSVVVAPAHGTVVVLDATSGAFVYTPAPNFSGQDEFRFAATDPGASSGAAVVRLDIRAVDDAPVAMPENMTAPASGSVTGQLRGYDRESKKVTFQIVEQPSSGKVKLLNERTGDFVFVAEGITARQVAFKFVVFDGALLSAPSEVVVDIRSHSF